MLRGPVEKISCKFLSLISNPYQWLSFWPKCWMTQDLDQSTIVCRSILIIYIYYSITVLYFLSLLVVLQVNFFKWPTNNIVWKKRAGEKIHLSGTLTSGKLAAKAQNFFIYVLYNIKCNWKVFNLSFVRGQIVPTARTWDESI